MSKVIMGNGGFYVCLSEPQGISAWWKETAQIRIPFFSFLVTESPRTSIKQSQTLTTHNANRHCRVRFYTFVGQPLSKQLYIIHLSAYFVKCFFRFVPTANVGKKKNNKTQESNDNKEIKDFDLPACLEYQGTN